MRDVLRKNPAKLKSAENPLDHSPAPGLCFCFFLKSYFFYIYPDFLTLLSRFLFIYIFASCFGVRACILVGGGEEARESLKTGGFVKRFERGAVFGFRLDLLDASKQLLLDKVYLVHAEKYLCFRSSGFHPLNLDVLPGVGIGAEGCLKSTRVQMGTLVTSQLGRWL